MSWEALYYATKKRAGKSSDKLVLLMLANLSDDDGFSFPSHAYLARVTEMSERSVQRSLDRLVEGGLITKKKRFNGAGQTSNGYTIAMEDVNLTPPHSQSDTPPSVNLTPYTKTDTLKIKQTRKNQNYPAEFIEFWEAYPRRPNDNKWNGFLKWQAAIKNLISVEDLQSAAVRFNSSTANTDPKFIPMCATWLNQRRYLDEQQEQKRNRNTLAG
jgi:hypothetical protein